MNDLLLWRLFEQEPIDVDQVEQLLRDLPGHHVFPFLEPIVRCIEAGPAPLRPAAIDALGRYLSDRQEIPIIPNPLLRRLVPCLDDSSPDVRAAAVRIFARHGPRIESVIYGLFHRDPTVRLECARAWEFGPANLRWLLLDPGTRDVALSQMARWNMPASTSTLADFLRACLNAALLTVEQVAGIAGELRDEWVMGRLILTLANIGHASGPSDGPYVDHSHDALHYWIEFSHPPEQELATFLAAGLDGPSSRSQLFEFIRSEGQRERGEDAARGVIIRSILSQPEWRASLTGREVADIATRLPFILTLSSIPLELRLSALPELDALRIRTLRIDEKVEELVDRILWEIEARGSMKGMTSAIVLKLAKLSTERDDALERILDRHPGLKSSVAADPAAVAEFLSAVMHSDFWKLAEILANEMSEPAAMLAPLCISQSAFLPRAPDRIFVTWGLEIVDRIAGMDLNDGDDFAGAMLTLHRLAPHLTAGQEPSTAGRLLGRALSRLMDRPANGGDPENASISLCGSLLASFTADELVFPIASAIEALPSAHRLKLLGAIVGNELSVPPAVAGLCTPGDDEERRLLEAWRGISGIGSRNASSEVSSEQSGSAVIDDAVARLLESLPEEALGSALERIVTTDAVHGVCDILERRPGRITSAEVCASILCTHDPLPQVARLVDKYGWTMRGFTRLVASKMERLALGSSGLPPIAHLWLRVSEGPHLRWIDENVSSLATLLATALELPGIVRTEMFRAAEWIQGVRRWRQPERFAAENELPPFIATIIAAFTVGEVVGPDAPNASEPVPEELKHLCIQMLERAHGSGLQQEAVASAVATVTPHIYRLPSDIIQALASLIDVRGLSVEAQEEHEAPSSTSPTGRSRLDSLLSLCQSPDSDSASASAAASELLTMGADEVNRLCSLVFSGVLHGRLLIRIVADSSAYPLAEARFRNAARGSSADIEARFEAAVQLAARGDEEARNAIPAIVNFETSWQWFEAEDWAVLVGLGLSEFDLAVAVITSPQIEVHRRALTLLLEAGLEGRRPVVASALRRFLDCGTERDALLREKAASRLAALGDWSGAPVLMAASMLPRELLTAPPEIIGRLAAAEILRDTQLGQSDGPQLIDSLGAPGTHSDETTERIMDMIVDESSSHAHRAKAVLWLGRRAHESRNAKLEALARTFAWGVKTARELTGKAIAIHITPTEAAYTAVTGRDIFVNPIALFRGDDDATEVVKGLILHELGHHRFNGGPEWRAIEELSREERKRALLNLVQDEHLERNLRAISREYGDALKKTATWVFRRWEREIPADLLIERLGVRSFEALTRLRLKPGIEGVRVKLGSLLSALEGERGSYAKFLPALRLGLGNRTGDEKVGQGLALFKGDFRNSSPERMLDIARELARIFHDDEVTDAPSLLELLAELSHSAHHPSEAELAEIDKHGRGISDEELQAAIDRELHEAGDSSHANSAAPPALTVNLSQNESFTRIDDVRAMTFDPESAREYSREVARWSRHLRRAFERLGLNMVQERRRLRGHSVDRSALLGAVLRGDPRVLRARRMEFATDLFLGVVIDCSGSMKYDDNIERAKSFAYLIAEAVKELRGVDVRFLGFTDSEIFDAGTALRCSAHALESGGGNNDAAALWHAAQLALASRRSAKLIVMISDGLPTECSVEALRALVKQLTKQKHLACAQVAVRPIEEVCFPHYVELQSEEFGASVREFARIVLRLVRQTLRAR